MVLNLVGTKFSTDTDLATAVLVLVGTWVPGTCSVWSDPNATKVDIFDNSCPRRRVHVLRMYRTSVFIKQYYGGEILETVPVLTLNWYYCAPLDFGLRVPVSPGHLVFSQVPGYFVYRYIRTAIRYKSQVLYLQVPVCKHRNVYRCLQIYKRIVTRPLLRVPVPTGPPVRATEKLHRTSTGV